ncbi:MAG: VWA domain-containing protein [Defluviitaleaceae bacterium]|nr:VWA domain-containing protein [Defluviitaleaceae bacterium]
MDEKQSKRWRLILGQGTEEQLGSPMLGDEDSIMDAALAAIYDGKDTDLDDRWGGVGQCQRFPNISKWLGDVRSFFPPDIVSVIQNDAIERKGLTQLLFEPETLSNVKPDISMVGALMSLRGQIPEKSKESAGALVQAVVDEIMKRIETDLRRAVTGALNKKEHSPLPSLSGTDWKRTISKNLKNYDMANRRIIPERFYFFERRKRSKDWTVILDIDQSGSMADSIIYASVMGAIFASMPALDTRVVAFDTEVVDLTEVVRQDPVDMLFGVQLGGGTDINKSVHYCAGLIENPKKTMFILISDLYEGGVAAGLLRKLQEMKESGVKCMVLLALSDSGTPSYDRDLGQKIANLGIPSFACSSDALPMLVEGAMKGFDLMALAENCKTRDKKSK